jgi:predicted nucleic acid-binding protein
MKLRRNPDQRDNILRQYFSQATMLIETRDVDQVEVLGLAEQFRLTAYDASYLWLARTLDAELVTLDRQLERAAASLQHR